MKRIGYWIESLHDDEFPPPQELVADYPPATRARIADYLDSGAQFAAYRGRSWCRFFCGHTMGCTELTDGTWVWPCDLSHYVREHCVRLPDEFIDAAGLDQRPSGSFDAADAVMQADNSFWVAWSAEHRSHALRARILSARAAADVEAEQKALAIIAERERMEGLSDRTCQWAGCDNRALRGRVLCASCLIRSDQAWSLQPGGNLRQVLKA